MADHFVLLIIIRAFNACTSICDVLLPVSSRSILQAPTKKGYIDRTNGLLGVCNKDEK